jgi:hypothetical protein
MENSSVKYAMAIHKKYTKMKNLFEDDNLIQKIFGGKIVSSVACGNCQNISYKIDKFIDISLVIIYANSYFRKFLIAVHW